MIFEKKFDSQLWKIIPGAKENHLAVELRKKEDKTVKYGVLDLQSSEFQLVGGSLEGAWWTGLLDFFQNRLLLHGYEEQGLPTHKGAYIYDIKSSNILWKNFEVSVKQTGVEGIMTATGKVLDWQDGSPIEAENFTSLDAMRRSLQRFPSLHLEGSEQFVYWKPRLEEVLDEEMIGQLALCPYKEAYVIQAYTGQLGKRLTGHWLWVEGRRIVPLAKAPLKGLLLDAFFIQLPYLFFMPADNKLSWMRLEPSFL